MVFDHITCAWTYITTKILQSSQQLPLKSVSESFIKVLHVYQGCKNIESGLCLYRNIFGPVLGSSPAQNAPVLPTLQPGFGGGNNEYSERDAYRM